MSASVGLDVVGSSNLSFFSRLFSPLGMDTIKMVERVRHIDLGEGRSRGEGRIKGRRQVFTLTTALPLSHLTSTLTTFKLSESSMAGRQLPIQDLLIAIHQGACLGIAMAKVEEAVGVLVGAG